MIKIFLYAVLLIVAAHQVAWAKTEYVSQPVSQSLFRPLLMLPAVVKVRKVIDPLTFISADDQLYALSGIEVPEASAIDADFTLKATKTLAKLIEGKELKLYQTKTKDRGRLNRMNQNLVQAEIYPGKIWVQAEMLATGTARVRTTAYNPEMSAEMLAVENEARQKTRGLWADPLLQVLSAKSVEGHENAFAVIEGTPVSASMTRNMVFLNFGNDYRKDFTIGIPSGQRIAFSRRNIDPLGLAHVPMRVRGWVRSFNGPFVEIDHPEQIELLGKPASGPVRASIAEPAPEVAGMRTIGQPVKPTVEKPQLKKPEIEKLKLIKAQAEQNKTEGEPESLPETLKKLSRAFNP